MLNSKTIEFLLNAVYAAALASSTSEQRAVANETLLTVADLEYAPQPGPDILHRIAGNASHRQAAFDPPEPPPAPRQTQQRREVLRPSKISAGASHLRLVNG